MKTLNWYLDIKGKIIEEGYWKDIEWSESIMPVDNYNDFWIEYAYVVINSGMKQQIASKIWEKVYKAVVRDHISASMVFGHKGKSAAIDYVWTKRHTLFLEYKKADDKLEFLESLPWIGKITKWHLAKNFGFDCAKPDRHLVRIAGKEGTHALCARLAKESGDRIATVDLVIWRAANLGLV